MTHSKISSRSASSEDSSEAELEESELDDGVVAEALRFPGLLGLTGMSPASDNKLQNGAGAI